MISFHSSYTSMKPAYWLVSLTFIVLPWLMMLNALPLLLFLFVAVVAMNIKDSKGVTFVILSMALCLPHMSYKDSVVSLFYTTHFAWLNRAVYLSILVSLFLFLGKKERDRNVERIIKVYRIISICLILLTLRFGIVEVFNWFWSILVVPVFFWLCNKDRTSWSDLYYMFTVFFIFIALYGFLDFFFQINPYGSLLSRAITLDDSFFVFKRAGGILGNPLLMVGFAIAYHVLLLVHYYRTGKFSLPLILLSLLVLIITGSRTAILSLLIVWFFYIVFLGQEGKAKMRPLFVMFIAGAIIYILGGTSLSSYMDFFFSRFGEGSEHREAGIQTAINILNANPWGVGYAGTEDAFFNYAAEGFVKGMQTVDNTYLTFLITDGYLFLFPFLFYYYIPLNALRHSMKDRGYKLVVMLLVPYVVCGFAFNITSFMQLNILYMCLAGHLYHIVNKKNKNGSFNYNSKL